MNNCLFRPETFIHSGCKLSFIDPASVESLTLQLLQIDPWKSLGFTSNGITKFILDDDPSSFKFQIICEAIEGDQPVHGLICIKHPWLKGPYLELLSLFPVIQGRGIGTALLNWMIGQAKLGGFRNVWVAVSEFNKGAQKFYTRSGFQKVASLSNLIKEGEKELLLRKEI